MRAFPKVKAFHLYCKGKSLAEIAEKIGYHRSTVERYASSGDWRRARDEAFIKKRDEIVKERAAALAERQKTVSDHLYTLFHEAHAEIEVYRKLQIPRKKMRYSLHGYLAIARTLVLAGNCEIQQVETMETLFKMELSDLEEPATVE